LNKYNTYLQATVVAVEVLVGVEVGVEAAKIVTLFSPMSIQTLEVSLFVCMPMVQTHYTATAVMPMFKSENHPFFWGVGFELFPHISLHAYGSGGSFSVVDTLFKKNAIAYRII